MTALRVRRVFRIALVTAAAGGVVVIGLTRGIDPPGGAFERLDATDVIRQRGADDCGVAAVAMLVRAAGGRVDADELWSSVRVPKGGLLLTDMAALSRRAGVAAEATAVPRKDQWALDVPWVAHLSWGHYVVVESVEDDRIIVADPRGARYAMPTEAFLDVWSGYGLARTSR